MGEETARGVGPAGIDVVFERFGEPENPVVLLIMGAGAQMIHWPDRFCAELVERGLHVVRFDNRDAVRSTHFTGVPDFPAAVAGDHTTASYTLSDMAADTVGLLDSLRYSAVHVVGASQGGMIAQTLAIDHPERVRSLTSIMSTTGSPDVGRTDMRAFGAHGAPPDQREAFVEWRIRVVRTLGSPGFEFDTDLVADIAARSFDRDHDHGGLLRQAVAVLASGDRTAALRSLQVPTLVIHGTDDLVIDVSGGVATADAVPGARLVTVPGMGHSLPRELWASFADDIAALVRAADSAESGPAA